MTLDSSIVGARIRAMRKAEGLTLEQFSKKCYLSTSKISSIEKGGIITLEDIAVIARAFEISPEALLYEDDAESGYYIKAYQNKDGICGFQCKLGYIKDTRRLLDALFDGLIRRVKKHELYSALETARIDMGDSV